MTAKSITIPLKNGIQKNNKGLYYQYYWIPTFVGMDGLR